MVARMRSASLVFFLLVTACKDKPKATPAPAPAPQHAAAATPEAATPAPVAKPAEAAPAPAIEPGGGFTTAAQYEAKAVDLVDKLTAVFAAAGTNCDKLADNLEVFLDENRAAFAGTDAFEAANPTAQANLQTKMQDKAHQFLTTANASMQACKTNARVTAALAKLPD